MPMCVGQSGQVVPPGQAGDTAAALSGKLLHSVLASEDPSLASGCPPLPPAPPAPPDPPGPLLQPTQVTSQRIRARRMVRLPLFRGLVRALSMLRTAHRCLRRLFPWGSIVRRGEVG